MSDVNRPEFWSDQYLNNTHGWDIGYVSPPLKAYFDQIENKSLRILVPGAGFGWEVKYLFEAGFKNVYLLDFSTVAIEKFKGFCPHFPEDHIIEHDFFDHSNTYDLIVEQTFFSGIPRNRRQEYFRKCNSFLSTKGKLVGLFFNHEFPFEGPPFGGTSEEYIQLLEMFFKINTFDLAYNSIKPRAQREIFFILQKK